MGGFGVVGANWCLGWEESRVCDMGFWCGWGGEVKIESWGLFLLVGFWRWWRIVDRVSSNHRFFGGEQPSDRRSPQQPLLLDPPLGLTSDPVSPLLLLQQSQFHRTPTPMLQWKFNFEGSGATLWPKPARWPTEISGNFPKNRQISRKIGKNQYFDDNFRKRAKFLPIDYPSSISYRASPTTEILGKFRR